MASPRKVRVPPGLVEALREGAVPLSGEPVATDGPLDIAIVLPGPTLPEPNGLVGELSRELSELGHNVELWLAEATGTTPPLLGTVPVEVLGETPFDPVDVAIAAGWQAVFTTLRLDGVGARFQLVPADEPSLYPDSIERRWATWTYGQGLHALCAGDVLAQTLRDAYGADASPFALGVDAGVFQPLPTHRRDDLVLLHTQAGSAGDALPLAVAALTELAERRPDVELAIIGDPRDIDAPFAHDSLGRPAPDRIAHAYSDAAVGVALGLTGHAQAPLEMLACGLPVVSVEGSALRDALGGADSPVAFCAAEPDAIAATIERLLDDLVDRADRSRVGSELAADRTWAAAAEQVDAALRR